MLDKRARNIFLLVTYHSNCPLFKWSAADIINLPHGSSRVRAKKGFDLAEDVMTSMRGKDLKDIDLV